VDFGRNPTGDLFEGALDDDVILEGDVAQHC